MSEKVCRTEKNKKDKLNIKTKVLMELLSEGKRETIEYVELNKTTRKMIEEDLRKHQEEGVEKILERNKGLKCLRISHGKLVITALRNKQEDEEKDPKRSLNSWKKSIKIYIPPR
ncbi:hypothetical protein HHI36_015708 [Cryptolaemus montrouzieri]|uniref:Uncharacterized protein n=1 Tax=Cryptolaemus montrouzieri TaxID=559131 RepID=A0ABD2N6D7_9CUCU